MDYTSETSNSIDENHTHFVFVDDGKQGIDGRELSFRSAFEAALCDKYQVPLVLVIVGGTDYVMNH